MLQNVSEGIFTIEQLHTEKYRTEKEKKHKEHAKVLERGLAELVGNLTVEGGNFDVNSKDFVTPQMLFQEYKHIIDESEKLLKPTNMSHIESKTATKKKALECMRNIRDYACKEIKGVIGEEAYLQRVIPSKTAEAQQAKEDFRQANELPDESDSDEEESEEEAEEAAEGGPSKRARPASSFEPHYATLR